MKEDPFVTHPAHEARRMPLRVQRGNIILHDGPVAAAALRRKHVKVVGATIRLAVPLMEPVLAKLLAALRTEKVLRVPGLLQSGHAFLKLIKFEDVNLNVKLKSINPSRLLLSCLAFVCFFLFFGCEVLLTSKMAPLQYAHRGLNRLW